MRPDPKDLLRCREQLLLALLVHHPALLQDAAEDLAALHFRGRDLESLRAALVDFAAQFGEEDAENTTLSSHQHLDSEALKRHLGEQGFSGVVDSLQSRKVLQHGRFARPEATEEAARVGFASVMAEFRQQAARSEMESAASDLARELDEKNLARYQAHQRLDGSDEHGNIDLDDIPAGDLAERH